MCYYVVLSLVSDNLPASAPLFYVLHSVFQSDFLLLLPLNTRTEQDDDGEGDEDGVDKIERAR